MPPTTSSLFYIKMLTTAVGGRRSLTPKRPCFQTAPARQALLDTIHFHRSREGKEGNSGTFLLPLTHLSSSTILTVVKVRSYELLDVSSQHNKFRTCGRHLTRPWPHSPVVRSVHPRPSSEERGGEVVAKHQWTVTPRPQQLWRGGRGRKGRRRFHLIG